MNRQELAYTKRNDAPQQKARAKPLQPASKRSTAGVDLGIVGRLTWAHREAIAGRHDRTASEAECLAVDLSHRPVSAAPLFVTRVRRLTRVERDRKGRAVKVIDVRKVPVPARIAAETSGRWHRARARGQLERMGTVGHCGDGKVVVQCGGCGAATESAILCGVVRLCLRCSDKRGKKARRKFVGAHKVLHALAQKTGRYLPFRRGGAYGERHVVLTVPHVTVFSESGEPDRKATAQARIRILFEAWPEFARRVQRWERQGTVQDGVSKHPDGRKKVRRDLTAYYRAFEWTPGADDLGHPHFHIWLHSPFLEEDDFHRVPSTTATGKNRPTSTCTGVGCALCAQGKRRYAGVRTWWSEALRKAGVVIKPENLILGLRRIVMRPVEFVREIRKPSGVVWNKTIERVRLEGTGSAGADLVAYLEGWCVATLDAETQRRCGDDVIAGVYEALEGRRLTQASMVDLPTGESVGFLSLGTTNLACLCPHCVTIAPKKVEVSPWYKDERFALQGPSLAGTGPPEAAGAVVSLSGEHRVRLNRAALAASEVERQTFVGLSPKPVENVREYVENLEQAAWDVRSGGLKTWAYRGRFER